MVLSTKKTFLVFYKMIKVILRPQASFCPLCWPYITQCFSWTKNWTFFPSHTFVVDRQMVDREILSAVSLYSDSSTPLPSKYTDHRCIRSSKNTVYWQTRSWKAIWRLSKIWPIHANHNISLKSLCTAPKIPNRMLPASYLKGSSASLFTISRLIPVWAHSTHSAGTPWAFQHQASDSQICKKNKGLGLWTRHKVRNSKQSR